MPWIKRNMIFVASVAVALALMGVAGWMVFSNMQKDTQIQDELNGQVSEAQRLHDLPGFPSDENIAEAKKQQAELKNFREQLKGVFTPSPTFPPMDDRKFNGYILGLIEKLRGEAEKANVALPPDFNFTFTPHKSIFQFPSNSIDGWLVQTADIKAICEVLFAAHVNALDVLQRVPVSPQVDTGSGEYLSDTVLTNKSGTTFAPYKISFRSFDSELASVLEGFSRSTNCIIVKAVDVVPSSVPLATASVASPTTPQRSYIPAYSRPQPRTSPGGPAEPVYGGGKGGGGYVAPTPVPQVTMPRMVASVPSGPVTVLKEEPLQINLLLEVVRLGKSQ